MATAPAAAAAATTNRKISTEFIDIQNFNNNSHNMKIKHILALAITALTATPTIAQDSAPGELLESINMFTPEEGDPAYKVTANEKYGTQWYADLAYAYWHSKNALSGYNNNANMALVHAVLNQRIIEDSTNGGTWVRFEFSGSWGLDRSSAKSDRVFADGFYTANYPHFDIYGAHDGVIPELSLMHYFAGKRACIVAGMVNMANYFDCVSIANDTFANFVNGGFVNSSVLALPDANLGAIVQAEINSRSYGMIGFSREATGYGDNPFSTSDGSFLLIAEYGRQFLDGAATLRFTPFFRHIDERDDTSSTNFGLAASIEYSVSDELTVYARTGLGYKQELGNAFDFSCGANIKLIPSREDDFLGLAMGVFKGCAPTEQNRELVFEAMYSYQVNDYFKIVPHLQYIANPAYDAENSDAVLMGVQGIFSF